MCRAGLGGGGAKALAGTIVMERVSVLRNAATDGGAFEVAKQAGSNEIPTVLLVKARTCLAHLCAMLFGFRGQHRLPCACCPGLGCTRRASQGCCPCVGLPHCVTNPGTRANAAIIMLHVWCVCFLSGGRRVAFPAPTA